MQGRFRLQNLVSKTIELLAQETSARQAALLRSRRDLFGCFAMSLIIQKNLRRENDEIDKRCLLKMEQSAKDCRTRERLKKKLSVKDVARMISFPGVGDCVTTKAPRNYGGSNWQKPKTSRKVA